MTHDDHDLLDPHRLDLRSADVIEPRMEALASLFPESVRDGKIDVEAIAEALGDVADDGPERFGLTWPGKAEAIRMAQRPSDGTLVPMKDESVDWDSTQNIVIEGENLEVLKLLQRSYHGKVKLIYIDPPYNTGKDFVYPDNFRDPLGEYLKFSGQVGENDGRLRANAETSGRYHSSWLSMMWPRLHMGRSLLTSDGLAAVSIDDNESAQLRLLMDEIFGAENHVGTVVWQHSVQPKGYTSTLSLHHNYLLLYARSDAFEIRGLERTEDHNTNYSNPDNDPRGRWRLGDVRNALPRPNLRYVLETPSGNLIQPPDNGWRWKRETMMEKIASGEIRFADDETRIQRRIYLDTVGSRAVESLWPASEVGSTRDGANELKALFDGSVPFDTVKPTKLIDRLLQIAGVAGDDLVLDYFAGSGTTGDAVLRANAHDGARRRFILVQIPTRDEGDTGSLAGLTRERVRRAGSAEMVSPRFRDGELDVGFRAYRLAAPARQSGVPATSDGQIVFDPAAEFDPSRDREALLTEVLLARGFDLVTPTEWQDVGGPNVALVADGAMAACFARHLTVEQFEALVALDPAQLVVLEAAFGGNDEIKVNSLQHLKTVNAHRDTPIELLVL